MSRLTAMLFQPLRPRKTTAHLFPPSVVRNTSPSREAASPVRVVENPSPVMAALVRSWPDFIQVKSPAKEGTENIADRTRHANLMVI